MSNFKTGKIRDVKCHFWNVNELNDKRANSVHLLPQIGGKNVKNEGKGCSSYGVTFLEREAPPSLLVISRSNRRQLSVQWGEMLYAERASRGYQIYGVSSNSKR